jgi:hypothetical protein
MATSKYAKGKWTAGALLYSGRRDPTWAVPSHLRQRLLKIWDSAERWTGDPPAPPPLGYRGCLLRDSENRQWHACGDVITLRAGQATESRKDPEREFEKLLLSSAPGGTLPRAL